MTTVRPDLSLLWPSYTLFPLAGLAVVVGGVAGQDGVMMTIGIALLALNAFTILNYAYFTEVRIVGDELVYRTLFGTHHESVPIGSLQRIDAKRYPGAHSGVSAPHFVARGRAATVKVNTKAYRLRDFAALIATLRVANARFELDPFWSRVANGEDVTKEVALTPRSRW
ncbi:MAG TPA: hypothetical protein VGA38_04815 [Candidatus Limnocylindria bacterium]